MENQLMGNRTVSFQHTTRTSMSNKSLKQANIIRAHSIPIAPKHDHLQYDVLRMGPVIIIHDGHPSKIDVSSLFFQILTFRNDESKRKGIKPPNHQQSVVSNKVFQVLYQVQAIARLKILKTVPSRQVASSRSSSSSGPQQDLNSLICRDLHVS
jgi:hypothetical protein